MENHDEEEFKKRNEEALKITVEVLSKNVSQLEREILQTHTKVINERCNYQF